MQEVGGDILARNATTLRVEYEDRTTHTVPFIWVSKPIDAGFFLYGIPMEHRTVGHRPHAVAALDTRGHVLARATFSYRRPTRVHPGQTPHYRLRTLPPPKAPFQRGEASGLRVIAGANGSVDFNTSGLQPALRAALSGGHASFGCFRFMRYHQDQPSEALYEQQAMKNGRIQIFKPGAGYDGCEAEGAYGHTWPDRFSSHSTVEIAFTSRGRRYFADRAAARDLALYVRSRHLHGLAGIRRLRSTFTPLPSDTIGYVPRGGTTTYVEQSTTGRRFFVILRGDKVVSENVKPLGFVF